MRAAGWCHTSPRDGNFPLVPRGSAVVMQHPGPIWSLLQHNLPALFLLPPPPSYFLACCRLYSAAFCVTLLCPWSLASYYSLGCYRPTAVQSQEPVSSGKGLYSCPVESNSNLGPKEENIFKNEVFKNISIKSSHFTKWSVKKHSSVHHKPSLHLNGFLENIKKHLGLFKENLFVSWIFQMGKSCSPE